MTKEKIVKPTTSRPHFIRCSELSDTIMRTLSPETGQRFTYALYVPEREGALLADEIHDIVSEIAGGFGIDRHLDGGAEFEFATALEFRIKAMQSCVDVHLAETSRAVAFDETHGMSEDEIILVTICPTISREEDLRSRGYWDEKAWTAPIALPIVGWMLGADEYWPQIPDHHGEGIYIIDVTTDTAFMAGISRLRLMDFKTNSQT